MSEEHQGPAVHTPPDAGLRCSVMRARYHDLATSYEPLAHDFLINNQACLGRCRKSLKETMEKFTMRRRWLCVVAILYLLLAWEQVPTFITSAYYCEAEAGLKIHKSPEQWRMENKRFLAELVRPDGNKSEPLGEFSSGVYVNKWILWKRANKVIPYLPVVVVENELSDIRTGEVLLTQVSVSAGYESIPSYTGLAEYKFWIEGPSCEGGRYQFFQLVNSYK